MAVLVISACVVTKYKYAHYGVGGFGVNLDLVLSFLILPRGFLICESQFFGFKSHLFGFESHLLDFVAFQVPVEFFRVRNRIFVAIAFRMRNAI